MKENYGNPASSEHVYGWQANQAVDVARKQISSLVNDIIKKGEKTLYLAIYNSTNQRSYITVKLK